MAIKDTDRKARANYKKKVEELRVELYPTDEDIKKRLEERIAAGEKKAAYVKRLVREDIAKDKEILKAEREDWRLTAKLNLERIGELEEELAALSAENERLIAEKHKPKTEHNGLKPCPFCGGKAKIQRALSNHTKYRLTHTCIDRHPHIEFFHYYFDTPQDARNFWNRRVE